MYHVYEHGVGRPGRTLKTGGVWETGLTGDEWRPVADVRKKAAAVLIADGIDHHAVVQDANYQTVHDNGKPPRDRMDWGK